MRVDLKNVQKVVEAMKARQGLGKTVQSGLVIGAERIMGEAKENRVPIDRADLKNSGHVEIDNDSGDT